MNIGDPNKSYNLLGLEWGVFIKTWINKLPVLSVVHVRVEAEVPTMGRSIKLQQIPFSDDQKTGI